MSKSTTNPDVNEVEALRKIREDQKITIESVADGMKVSRDFVRYIEEGQFEKLGAPTFLRGHITNYSKVLGLDPQQILELIPGQFLQHHELKTAEGMAASPLARVRRQSNHFGRYAVGTALLGMLTLSFYFIWDKWSMPKRTMADTPVDLATSDDDNSVDKKITYSSLLPQVSGPQLSQADNEDAGEDAAIDGESVEAAEQPAEDTQQDDATEQMQLDDTNIMATVEQNNDVSTATYTIKMQLEEQAWVSIKTLDGDKIVHDLIGPGLREYQSDEPLHFRIGNANKLQLLINEDPVELSSLIKRDIADFEWPLNPS